MPPEHAPSLDALRQAAEWFAVLGDRGAGEPERRRWQAWLDASAEHRSAWARVEAVTRSLAGLGEQTPPAAARGALGVRHANTRRHALKLLAAGGLTVLAGWLGPAMLTPREWLTRLAAWRADERTAIGEVRQVTLADGGLLWLNTASAADIEYGAQLRRIALHAGELLVDSVPDTRQPSRPLVVDTPHGRLTALGTRFAVRLDGAHSQVSVFEGAVEVAPHGLPASVLQAGSQTRFSEHTQAPFTAAQPARESWTRGLLVADDRRLDDFVAELGGYVPLKVEVAPEAGALRLVGVYPMHDPARDFTRALAAIQRTLPVRVRQAENGRWRIELR
ncbi:DUF4880 domain-containing protein [Pseudothauera nasutitermitis]|uniref:DUF4880 domain-containing protein n=1 Tax=Pseudothauera nasutitermitis TaxID=2565930 RepID=A0A4S4AXF5_9RHOO|nr:FecR domain-containing protein [Pseudothauera nasutitermitis]THF64734.1 DUF4880 domain-containing protein [Pseudothauera nasutitermitis]